MHKNKAYAAEDRNENRLGLELNFNPTNQRGHTTDGPYDLNDGRRTGQPERAKRRANDGPNDERTGCYLYTRFRYYLPSFRYGRYHAEYKDTMCMLNRVYTSKKVYVIENEYTPTKQITINSYVRAFWLNLV
jgi:hypothetical protein